MCCIYRKLLKYENAKNVFPDALLKEVQKHVQGKVIYIPIGEEKRQWGETSGYKQYLNERNSGIREKFMRGTDVISLQVIRHIITSHNNARDLIMEVDRDELVRELIEVCLVADT